VRRCRYCFAHIVLLPSMDWGSVVEVGYFMFPEMVCDASPTRTHWVLVTKDAIRDIARVYHQLP